MNKVSDWLFRHLFPCEYEHMRELVDDVIKLEAEKRQYQIMQYAIQTISGSNSKTLEIKS